MRQTIELSEREIREMIARKIAEQLGIPDTSVPPDHVSWEYETTQTGDCRIVGASYVKQIEA